MKTILLLEDERALNLGLTCDLELENYRVCSAFTIAQGRRIFRKEKIDLVLLDRSLPDGDGILFCREIKKERNIPVIFLTARDMEEDEIAGFDCGADDYITKPFKVPILHRRIQAALRRAEAEELCYDDGHLVIDFKRLTAALGGKSLALTPTEYRLLRLLIANEKTVMTKRLLLEKLWDSNGSFVDEHAVAVNINRLRKKIESGENTYIKTLYGVGYQWNGYC